MNLKRILIAIDTSENSAKAVDYAAAMVGDRPEYFVELVSVHRAPDRHIFHDEKSWKAKDREERDNIHEALDNARRVLVKNGVPEECVSTRSIDLEKGSIADAIIAYGREEDFGTLVVGRRGVSKSEEVMFGSVSKRVVTHAKDCAVWVVE